MALVAYLHHDPVSGVAQLSPDNAAYRSKLGRATQVGVEHTPAVIARELVGLNRSAFLLPIHFTVECYSSEGIYLGEF